MVQAAARIFSLFDGNFDILFPDVEIVCQGIGDAAVERPGFLGRKRKGRRDEDQG